MTSASSASRAGSNRRRQARERSSHLGDPVRHRLLIAGGEEDAHGYERAARRPTSGAGARPSRKRAKDLRVHRLNLGRDDLRLEPSSGFTTACTNLDPDLRLPGEADEDVRK